MAAPLCFLGCLAWVLSDGDTAGLLPLFLKRWAASRGPCMHIAGK